ncbi:cytochrome c-type biogenesis protein CcmH [Sulfitobacter sp. SK012]|uniref:cytochrome c-type biogenesis protein n=1 Tax=Sulfitobacter sp. SK012 TaxID=1389005 RepID=UPI000E0B2FE9|nr:cytochrome c-type biogenesis protein [Sulfitobacter sp. SK012]AXI47195.1 cytochrome c-type biogenesis protein CcmH [Sulfitobacter sp. SK012]
MIRILLVLGLFATAASAVEPDEILSDPTLEARARVISANLRCVVCQNEPIDTSNAGVARDLRLLVRERLVAGDTDKQVFDYVVARYGDYVLFKPPWKSTTYALWLTPIAFAIFGMLSILLILRRSSREFTIVEALSPEEEAQLSELEKRKKDRDI